MENAVGIGDARPLGEAADEEKVHEGEAMKMKESSGAKRRRMATLDRGDGAGGDRSTSFLPLAFHFEGAGTILMGVALAVALVGSAFLNASSAGVVGHVSLSVPTGSATARSAISLASPLLLCGQILVVLGALFGALRGDSQRGTLRRRVARLSAALWGLGLALLLTRVPLGQWLSEHVTWGASALRVLRWVITLAALGTTALVVRANTRELSVRKGLRAIDVGLGLVVVQIVVSLFHNALFAALWNSRLRAMHGALELAGSLGLFVAGAGLFVVARSMHHAWIEGAEGAAHPS